MVSSKKGKPEKDLYTSVLITQFAVCAIIVILMLISFKNNGSFFRTMADGYSENTQNDYGAEEVSDAFVKIDEYAQAFADNMGAESESQLPQGGKDIVFNSVDALEGVCLRNILLDFELSEPLDDYVITSHFGYRVSPISGKTGIHTGVDMAADYGESIYAAADGEVLDAGRDSSYGNYVKLQHDDNVVSIYAHCSSLCVSSGEKVKSGDLIARVGSTGDSTGNHLHFEVRKDNIKINPEFLLFGDEKA